MSAFVEPVPDAVEISQAVRSFSFGLGAEEMEQNKTALCLVSHVQAQDASAKAREDALRFWRTWYSSDVARFAEDQQTQRLQTATANVMKAWKDFNRHFKGMEIDVDESTVPSFATLQLAISKAQRNWEGKQTSRLARAKKNVMKFMNFMGAHETLFSILPNDCIYTSVFSGVISTMVTASTNYLNVAEGFFGAILEINETIAFVLRGSELVRNAAVQAAVVDLYVEVFDFLCHAMRWYDSRWKRAASAFNSNFFDDHVRGKVDRINGIANRLKNHLSLRTNQLSAETNKTSAESNQLLKTMVSSDSARHAEIVARLERIEAALREGDRTTSVERIEQRKTADISRCAGSDKQTLRITAEIFQNEVGYQMQMTLESAEKQANYNDLVASFARSAVRAITPEPPGSAAARGEDSRVEDAAAMPTPGPANPFITRAEIERMAEPLRARADDGRAALQQALRSGSRLMIPNEVVLGIQTWLKSTESTTLWIEGSHGASYGTGLSPALLYVRNLLVAAEIPCITFFPRSRYPWNSPLGSHHELAVVDLLHSLVDQLVNVLPPVLDTGSAGPDLAAAFARLDAAAASIEPALKIVEKLIRYAPDTLAILVDNLQELEQAGTLPFLRRLLDVLGKHQKEATVKLLFTTSGQSRVLLKTTEFKDRVNVSGKVNLGVSRLVRGASSMSTLK